MLKYFFDYFLHTSRHFEQKVEFTYKIVDPQYLRMLVN